MGAQRLRILAVHDDLHLHPARAPAHLLGRAVQAHRLSLPLDPRVGEAGHPFRMLEQVVDDVANRKALYDRFAYSQQFSQSDPWEARARRGVDHNEFKPLAELELA